MGNVQKERVFAMAFDEFHRSFGVPTGQIRLVLRGYRRIDDLGPFDQW